MSEWVGARRDFIRGQALRRTCLTRLRPRVQPGPPPANVPAVLFVVSAEFSAQGWFLIQPDEQMHACCGEHSECNGVSACPSEDDPQANPAGRKPYVHRV